MNTGRWHKRVDTSCSTSHAAVLQKKKTTNDQKETEQNDYQSSKGNRTKRLSMINMKQNKKTITDQKETEQKDYQ